MSSLADLNHVVFDFDGVIIDSERKKFSDLKKILKKHNYEIKEAEFKKFKGKKRIQFLREIGVSNKEKIMKQVHEKDLEIDNLDLIKGLETFLTFLSKNDVKMHIATGSSKKFVMTLLEKFKLSNYFTEIITGDDVKESKPNPKIYLEIKRKLNDSKIIVIEDSPAGVTSAKNAGLFVIGLGKDLNADIEMLNFNEILRFFKNK